MKILKAYYGTFTISNRKGVNKVIGDHKIDVTSLLNDKIVNNKLRINVENDLFSDPNNGVSKSLYVEYEDNGVIKYSLFNEHDLLELPKVNSDLSVFSSYTDNNPLVLLITSCNRIKQVLLALSINEQIIKRKFSVIIMDTSTPDDDPKHIINKLQAEDPYNKVKSNNYCSDINLLYKAHASFKNIEEFKVIHYSPRLSKQQGEATLVGLGLMQASLMGDRLKDKEVFCLKLSGTSILKHDVLSALPEMLADKDIVTWHRSNIGGYERSTRIFGCRPEKLVGVIAEQGWKQWCDDRSGALEYKLAYMIDKNFSDRVNYTEKDDQSILLEGAADLQWSFKDKSRKMILEFIEKNNINVNATPYLQEFMSGGIY
jgi:hypothetical protein